MNKHLKYLKYLAKHKWFVLVAGFRIGGVPKWRLVIHDWSKFSPLEWRAYTNYFYGEGSKPKSSEACQPKDFVVKPETKAAFDRAWVHHQHLNPHHWQHWILRKDNGGTKALPMPEHFAREMVADWSGAGRAILGKWDIEPWYLKNYEIVQLHPETRKLVDKLIFKK